MEVSGPVLAGHGSRLPFAVWLLHMALPLLGLWLLVARPEYDARWEHHHGHFWLVLSAAGISLLLAARINEQARRRADARLFLVSLAFVTAAGFLGLHALATPGVLLGGKNVGFAVATPVGLLLAGALALASSAELSPAVAQRVIAAQGVARLALAALLAACAVLSLAELPALQRDVPPTEVHGPLLVAAAVGSLLYGTAALRYYLLHRRRPAAVLLSILTSFVLLAEALIATAYARNWQASWWEWHLLMVTAFGFVAYSANVQYEREGSRSGLFNSIALERTLQDVRREHSAALEALVDAMEADRGGPALARVTARLADRFGLTERQAEVLERGAEALAAERDQIRRLGALVAVGQEASVIHAEDDLLRRVAELVQAAFRRDTVRLGIVRAGALVMVGAETDGVDARALRLTALETGAPVSSPAGDLLVLPLTVKGRPSGVLEAARPDGRFAERDRSVLASLASQLSIAVENARLYAQLDGLFRSYMSPDVVTALLADPEQAALGGAVQEVTVLMADLKGFTPYAERSSPGEVVAMLNAYYGRVVPCVLAHGGTVVQFVGDAVMALFNAPVRQHDHAARAVAAALALQDAVAAVAQPGWPPFRVGVNTGPALVGNIGSEAFRNYTAIGDTTNLAARLESAAPAGEVVIGEATYDQVRDRVDVQPMGAIAVKGKAEPVPAYVVTALRVARD